MSENLIILHRLYRDQVKHEFTRTSSLLHSQNYDCVDEMVGCNGGDVGGDDDDNDYRRRDNGGAWLWWWWCGDDDVDGDDGDDTWF